MESISTTEELFLKARTLLRKGHTVSKACQTAGIPRSTYYCVLAKKRRAKYARMEEKS